MTQDHACLSLQVVLLGDHKQLRPVVKSEQLQNLGLDRSLLQRYRRDASMLDLQYCVVGTWSSWLGGGAWGTLTGLAPSIAHSLPYSTKASVLSPPWNSTKRN